MFDNAQDNHGIAIVNCENFVNMFLNLPGSHLKAEETSKRFNSGGGYSLEVSCNYCLTIEWVKKKITVILREHTAIVQNINR